MDTDLPEILELEEDPDWLRALRVCSSTWTSLKKKKKDYESRRNEIYGILRSLYTEKSGVHSLWTNELEEHSQHRNFRK